MRGYRVSDNSGFWETTSMGILEAAKPAVVICTRNRERATAFYRDTLGLTLAYEDRLAAVFNVGGITLRISTVPDFSPHEHTILGFCVPDVTSTVRALRENGVTFNTYPHVPQDALGILTVPGGTASVAWLSDPDGNVLSVTNE
jgi:predicted enzyme related to lactoylglutathione lyase